MNKKFVAVSPKGKEFMYKRDTMIAVPMKSAERIAKFLTAHKYKIKDGEAWAVHDNDIYNDEFIAYQIKSWGSKEIKIYKY